VSFAKNVLPALDSARCTMKFCHGTSLSPAIHLNPDDAELSYKSLTTAKVGGNTYVKPGVNVPDASSITCNLAGKCGKKMPPLGDAPPELVKTVATWLACGAPKN
jgi:hypothetical protein